MPARANIIWGEPPPPPPPHRWPGRGSATQAQGPGGGGQVGPSTQGGANNSLVYLGHLPLQKEAKSNQTGGESNYRGGSTGKQAGGKWLGKGPTSWMERRRDQSSGGANVGFDAWALFSRAYFYRFEQTQTIVCGEGCQVVRQGEWTLDRQ